MLSRASGDLQPLQLAQAVKFIIEGLKISTVVEVKVARTGEGKPMSSDVLTRSLSETLASLTGTPEEGLALWFRKLQVELKAISPDGVVFCVYR